MKKLQQFLLFTVVAAFLVLVNLLKFSMEVSLSILIFIFLYLGFNLTVRRYLYFKPYFLSKFNFFTSSVSIAISFEIPKEILFERIKAVLDKTSFKLVDINRESFELLALTSMTWKSWGENLYFEIKSDESGSIVKVTSCTASQKYSLGKNQQNLNKLMDTFKLEMTK